MRALFHKLYGSAAFVLVGATAMWGVNVVVARAVVGEISPMAMTGLRWFLVSAILLATGGPRLGPELKALAPHWRKIGLMGAFGFTGFNALFYAAGARTTGVHLAILQGAAPVFLLLGAVALQGARVGLATAVGFMMTLVGIALVATQGSLAAIAAEGLNLGDAFILIADVLYAGYTLALRNKPKAPGLVFFTALSLVAFATSLPLVAIEIAQGGFILTGKGAVALAYVALFPSLVAQVFFIRGVELIGPSRAGLFYNLTPIFGALFSIVLLGEPFGLYHAAALGLVLGGIGLAERTKHPR